MRKLFTSEQNRYLKSIYKGHTFVEITKLFNKRFQKSFDSKQIRNTGKRRGLKNGLKYNGERHKKYSEKHIAYLKKIVPGRHHSESLKLFNEQFGFSLGKKAFATLCKRYCIFTGLTGCFPKGHIPFNKGKKGYCSPGSEKGWFHKGHKPDNWRPVGSERINADGYVEIKVSNTDIPFQKRWMSKQIVVWEKLHGSVPKGHKIVFLDGNKYNFTLDNLMMVSNAEHYVMNHLNWYTRDKNITKANIAIVKIKCAIGRLKRKTFTNVKNEKMAFLDNKGMRIVVAQVGNKQLYVPARKTQNGIYRLLADIKARRSLEAAQRDLFKYAQHRGWQRI